MNLALKSSPGFREKLAEREEAIPSCNALFHRDIFNTSNIRFWCTSGTRNRPFDGQDLSIKTKREPRPKAASVTGSATEDPGRMRTAACESDAPARCQQALSLHCRRT